MAEAFIYMYFVCFGGSLGVATVVFISWKVYSRSKNKRPKQRKVSF